MKSMKRLFIAALLMISVLALSATPIHATGIGEQIQRFDSQITISQDNTAKIKETIVYDFSNNLHHGIYRDIPVDYHDNNDKYYLNFKLIGAWDDINIPLQTKVSTENGNKRIRIGDPDTTITGVHTYQISYELSPLITNKNGTAFLNLDVVGEGWEVPINNISAKITLEGAVQLSNVIWYGATNLSATPTELIVSGVDAYQGITINADLPSGYIKDYLQPNKQRIEDVIASIWNVVITIVIIALMSGVLAIGLTRIIRTRMRRKRQIVVAQYEPPTHLSPAHIGLLEDDVAEGREITATVIEWAVKGYIKIAYIPKKGIFGSKDYQLILLKNPDDLPAHEIPLFEAFFDGEKSVKLSQLNKVAVSAQVIGFKQALKSQLSELGYYDKDGPILMRGTLTEAGAKQWALVDGFKLYLSVVEKDRLKFSDAPEKTPERFSKLLPYAIALGVEKQWAKQFEGIDLTQSTTWYNGNLAAFSAVALASDLGSSFAATVSSNSTVSSSGGSSGGGFGGGGGGSW